MCPLCSGVHDNRRDDLFLIGRALDGVGRLFGLAQQRQQHGNEQGNDGNHHQQLDERKPQDHPRSCTGAHGNHPSIELPRPVKEMRTCPNRTGRR